MVSEKLPQNEGRPLLCVNSHIYQRSALIRCGIVLVCARHQRDGSGFDAGAQGPKQRQVNLTPEQVKCPCGLVMTDFQSPVWALDLH